jgi:release factor glutamine methyltransferase
VTVSGAHHKYTSTFKEKGIADALDEARVLICNILKITSADFYARPDRLLSNEEQSALEALVDRRLKGEPSAYIVNSREFYGIDFYVDSRVLVPRPETEILVEAVLEFSRTRGGSQVIADVGTGSGAIAVALALNLPGATVYAVDISGAALEVATRNVGRYGLQDRINLLKGDLLAPLPSRADVIVANLPYIAGDEMQSLPVEVSGHEPEVALSGGERGTEVIGRLLAQVKGRINPGGILLLEIGMGQEDEIFKMVKRILPSAGVTLQNDLAGIKRVVKVTIPSFDIDECLL